MHHMMRKPRIAKPARQPAIPPTTAPVLTELEEPAVEEGVADAMVPVPIMIPVGDVSTEVGFQVAAAAGVVDSTVCGAKVGEVNEEEVLEDEVMPEDVVDEDVVEEEEVVLGVMEVEDCWVEVGTGVVEVGVGVVTARAELMVGVLEFCAADVCVLAPVAEVKPDPMILGLKRAAKRM
jgi:hypothetical protein